nr:ABC transporter permease [Chloroflexota bacterium]
RYGENFYSSFNLWELLRNNAYFGLIALGMTFVIMTGGIDLSVGSVVAMSAVVAARLSPDGIYVATAGAVLAGLAAGLINGGIIARFRVQPFIVTLAMLLAARGMALILSDNATYPVDFRSSFIDIGQREIGPVPLPVVIVIIAYLLGSIVLNFTRFGRHVLAMGGNEEAARLAGLPIWRVILGVYAISGALAGLAGAILAALSYSASPISAVGWELSAIAAVVVGGTLLTGGLGSVGTTLVGVLLIGLIFNVLNFERGRGTFELNVYWENVIRGVFLLVVIILQSRLARRSLGQL